MHRSTRNQVVLMAAAGGIVATLYGFALIDEHYSHSASSMASVAQMDPARRLQAICNSIIDADNAAARRNPRRGYIFNAPVLQEFASIYGLACGLEPHSGKVR
jgi:hypothetical protein